MVLHQTVNTQPDTLNCSTVGFGRYENLTCCGKVHRHGTCELGWLKQGRTTLLLDFQKIPLEEGTMVFISPGQLFAWENNPQAQGIGAVFSPEALALFGGRFSSSLHDLFFGVGKKITTLQIPHEKRPLFDFFFQTALNRQTQVGMDSDGLMLGYINIILAELQHLEAVDSQTMQMSSPAARLTRDFYMLMERDYLARKKVREYATDLAVSANHLTETIRQQTGLPPSQLLQHRLAIEAKRLLIHTSDSVSNISEILSFHSVTQFGSWFRRAEGMTPLEFRQGFIFP